MWRSRALLGMDLVCWVLWRLEHARAAPVGTSVVGLAEAACGGETAVLQRFKPRPQRPQPVRCEPVLSAGFRCLTLLRAGLPGGARAL